MEPDELEAAAVADAAHQVDDVEHVDDGADVAAPQRPLREFQGSDVAELVNGLASRMLGGDGPVRFQLEELPEALRYGEAAAALLEERTGSATVRPHVWLAVVTLVLGAAFYVKRQAQISAAKKAAAEGPRGEP